VSPRTKNVAAHTASAPAGAPRARKGHGRQRQRLIEACIAALHIYGPSRTTVAKVVAIAKMSPGIVRFYFDSKAALLVASLQFLAAEFEERVLLPVAQLKFKPVAALELLVDLHLDPDIASPRKVSVWYAFWGEASSRQEYYDICGQKDERFAALVRELIERLITETAQPHLDADGVALGLIGALEIMWQEFAFRAEGDIDRPRARRRCMDYLRSVFPDHFPAVDQHPAPRMRAADAAPPLAAWPYDAARPRAADAAPPLAAWAYDTARLRAMERDLLFQPAWAAVGHESQIPHAGDFLTIDTGAERVLVVRDADGAVHALRNNCPQSPHTLVARRSGRFTGNIECTAHALEFSLQGRRIAGAGGVDLGVLGWASLGGLMFVRSAPLDTSRVQVLPPLDWFDPPPPPGLMALRPPLELAVAADWKIVVEQWLESSEPDGLSAAQDSIIWHATPASDATWSARCYRRIVACAAAVAWRRQFSAPNQLFESRPDGLSVLAALPAAPGCCVVRRMDYTVLPPADSARAALYLAGRLGPYARRAVLDVAESVQRGMIEFGYEAAVRGGSSAVGWLRRRLGACRT
jgi:TetR/AcrR family transcriptional repressor of bet genes